MGKLGRAYKIAKHKGVGFCAYRAGYAMRKKLGLLKRRFPAVRWDQISLADLLVPSAPRQGEAVLESIRANGRRFFFNPEELPRISGEAVVAAAERVLQNKFQYFFNKWHELGDEVGWFVNPLNGQRAKADGHWSEVDMANSGVGDIKLLWEPSRFAWVYTLVRALAASGDEKYADKFWGLLESWLKANEPNRGPNYVCGQECAIRLMAMCFGLYGFWEAKESTADRKVQLLKAIGVHAERIEKNIAFAISTRTNHSLTEATGIYTAGMLFPEFKRSARWVKLGKKVLTKEALKQIAADGSYIQHSMNYQRLMLQDMIWSMRLGELNGDGFADELVEKVHKAVEFLYQLQDESGRVPNYGSNDGALIVPLNDCGYPDCRGVLQAGNYLANKNRLYEPGPWDEDMVWLFGEKSLESPIRGRTRESRAYGIRGYYSLRNKNSWAMIRCGSYTERPSHADMLHMDLWWKGQNVLRDSGTYMYTCDEPWESYFGSTAAHNTIRIDGRDQMRRASRFMWFDWTKAKLIDHKSSKTQKMMQGEHYGYKRKGQDIIHRRGAVVRNENCWVVVDDVLGTGRHEIELFWQICDGQYELRENQLIVNTAAGTVEIRVECKVKDVSFQCLKGDSRPLGWESLYYGDRQAAAVLVCSGSTELPVRFVTVISLGNTIANEELKQVDADSLLRNI